MRCGRNGIIAPSDRLSTASAWGGGHRSPPNALAQRCGATPSRIEALRACLAAAANNTMHPLRLCDVRHSEKWPGAQNATHP
ncbi:hypothetical protein CAI18_04775 [Xanthomonas citri pv. punicae]|nr:hypothetical protein CAI14_16395 [Xanthomonas citri pv. punicae]CCF68035.1 hypothetical protein XAPC_1742 [Xanthomonas citri pv. punicae str. LMG 859]QCZ69609.1 hypothetical protein CAI17_14030 [Xanthomonas citri pv. punicae]QCZ73852.1 hypothetical protein CAB38_15260 [Xanthomonas citri pv. punicae]QCZ75907.1 hypothetical protein XapA_02745 [Xanthomonas citri pv. punicae]